MDFLFPPTSSAIFCFESWEHCELIGDNLYNKNKYLILVPRYEAFQTYFLNGDFQSPMAKILNGFDQKSKGALSHALAEKLGIGTVPNWGTLLAEVCWLQAQSQDPLEQWVRPLVCMPNPKWPCMSLPLSWDLQVPWFGSMGEWHVNPAFFSLILTDCYRPRTVL